MVSRSQVIASVTSRRQQKLMMQYMVLIVHQLAEQRVVGVVNQFSHRQLIDRTEAEAHSTANDCLKTISIRCRAEAIPGTGSVNKFGDSNRLENNLQCGVRHAVIAQCSQSMHSLCTT